ncbi:O-antigen ligase family protein [Flavobacteriales bacterium]|nr:O-antigen ligase family protein [Flavobacteriales bacterium]
MIKKFLFFISIFGALTNLYPLFSALLGLKFSVVTFLFLLVNILILVLNFKEFITLLKQKKTFNFLLFFFFIPLVLSVLTEDSNFNFIFANIYFLTITFVSAILLQYKYKKLLAFILLFSLVLNLVTTILSMYNPELFLKLADVFDKSIYAGGRGFGLFLQPNTLGHSAVLIFIFSASIFSENRILYFWTLFLSMTTIFLSGSRSSIFIFFIAIFVQYLINLSISRQIKFSYTKYFLFLICVIFSFFHFTDMRISEFGNLKNLKDRMITLLDTQNISKDPSQLEREYKREAYYDRIMKKPILGHGIGSQHSHKNTGLLSGSAHNTHIDIFYQGGILYYMFYIFFFMQLLYTSTKLKKLNESLWSFYLNVICISFLLSFITSSLFSLRVLFVVFGPMLILNNPIQTK